MSDDAFNFDDLMKSLLADGIEVREVTPEEVAELLGFDPVGEPDEDEEFHSYQELYEHLREHTVGESGKQRLPFVGDELREITIGKAQELMDVLRDLTPRELEVFTIGMVHGGVSTIHSVSPMLSVRDLSDASKISWCLAWAQITLLDERG